MKKKQSRREAEPRIAPGRILLCGVMESNVKTP